MRVLRNFERRGDNVYLFADIWPSEIIDLLGLTPCILRLNLHDMSVYCQGKDMHKV